MAVQRTGGLVDKLEFMHSSLSFTGIDTCRLCRTAVAASLFLGLVLEAL